jgi:hypothetical protein
MASDHVDTIVTLALVAIFGGCAASALRANDQPVLREHLVQWVWANPGTNHAAHLRLPDWQRIAPERVAIDLSLDDGATWTEFARGVDSAYGTNSYLLTLPDWPQFLSDYARIRLRCIRTYANPAPDHIGPRFPIAGIHYVALPTAVTNGVATTLSWVAAGVGEFVQLGSRAPTESAWRPDGLFVSQDSIAGAATNSVEWTPVDLSIPTAHIILQSSSNPKIYRTATLQVSNP